MTAELFEFVSRTVANKDVVMRAKRGRGGVEVQLADTDRDRMRTHRALDATPKAIVPPAPFNCRQVFGADSIPCVGHCQHSQAANIAQRFEDLGGSIDLEHAGVDWAATEVDRNSGFSSP